MGRRRKAREDALKLLYQTDMVPAKDLAAAFEIYWQERGETIPDESREFAEAMVRNVLDNTDKIDALIQGSAHNWRLERIAAVDRSVLRLATCELLYQSDVPPAVVINEAIEVARRYSTEESSQFINGVLDGIRRSLEESPSEEEPAPGATSS